MGLPWALGTAGAGAAQGQCWALGAPSEPGEGLWGHWGVQGLVGTRASAG